MSEILFTILDKVLIETCLFFCIKYFFIHVWHTNPFIVCYFLFPMNRVLKLCADRLIMINGNDGLPIMYNGSIFPLISLFSFTLNVDLSLLGSQENMLINTSSQLAVFSSIMLPVGVNLKRSSRRFSHECSQMPKNVFLQGKVCIEIYVMSAICPKYS